MKKVLVTGANGLLGSHIVRQLLREYYTVRVLVRPHSDLRALSGLDAEFFMGKVTQKKDVENAVKDCDYVIHSAARTSPQPTKLEAFKKINIESTLHCLGACRKHHVKRFVYVSTANCFGNGTRSRPGDENTPFLPWLKKSGYAYSKRLAQELVLNAPAGNGPEAVVVNPTFIIGDHDVKPSSGQIFFHILNKKVAFYPSGGKNFVDARAAAIGVVKAMDKGTPGECYLLAGENLTYKEFYQLTARMAGQTPLLIPIPGFLLTFLGYGSNFLEKVLGIPVPLTAVNARMLRLGNYYTPAKAMKELQFPLVPANDAVKKAILWFRENGYF